MAFGVPDYIFRDYSSVTPEFLKSIGVKLVICDIDNTIAPYEVAVPDAQIEAWFTAMKDAGITFVFVSNNHADRAELFNQSLGLKVYADAKKPLTMALTKALSDAGLSPKDGASLGDQIFTDIWAGQFRGLQTILVPPIKDKTNLFFRSKRVLERPFIAAYFKKHPDEELLAYWNLKTRNLKEQRS